jgi:dienelactone hydrolase
VLLYLGALLLCGAACSTGSPTSPGGDPGPVDAPHPSLVIRQVAPALTGPGIVPVNGGHVVAIEGGERGELLLFFPGTGGRPDQYEEIVRRAAELGYHVISLSYVNTLSVNFSICNRYPGDRDCHERVRLEILTGGESGYDPPDVDPANAAFARLSALLAYLDTTYPTEGWGRYLEVGAPRWSRIAVAGHSQGGGHAAMTAKLHAVPRAILFGATEPQAWTLDPFETPASRIFGLAHADEINFAGITRSWGNLGVPGAPRVVEATPAPWGGSHRLVSTRNDCVGSPTDRGLYHNCPIVDEYLPRDGEGRPALLDVWDYLLTSPTPG